ncbi:WRKY domain [Dillenia turbinata]|uniref:WRKY domain n=1 Tax=Dillenia turbinata TaxID=194707 RepID=A0AAN8ZC43_9MAGN
MDSGMNSNTFGSDQEERGNTPESGGESPPSPMFIDDKPSASSPKRSRRTMQKRVVSVPIKDVEGSRLKGEGAPPSDSWAWRKYGQKPIKGSPYPRGYYRCSSSKGCPARKQVERSRVDPTMLVVTYSSEHNHPWPPASRTHHSNHHHHRHNTTNAAITSAPVASPDPIVKPEEHEPDSFSGRPEPEEKFSDLCEESLEFNWFSDFGSTSSSSSAFLDCPILGGGGCDAEMAVFFPMREEDEKLFADLGELPESSVVFRRGVLERDEERRLSATSFCESTG